MVRFYEGELIIQDRKKFVKMVKNVVPVSCGSQRVAKEKRKWRWDFVSKSQHFETRFRFPRDYRRYE